MGAPEYDYVRKNKEPFVFIFNIKMNSMFSNKCTSSGIVQQWWCSLIQQQLFHALVAKIQTEVRPALLLSSHLCDPAQGDTSRAVCSPSTSPAQHDGPPVLSRCAAILKQLFFLWGWRLRADVMWIVFGLHVGDFFRYNILGHVLRRFVEFRRNSDFFVGGSTYVLLVLSTTVVCTAVFIISVISRVHYSRTTVSSIQYPVSRSSIP